MYFVKINLLAGLFFLIVSCQNSPTMHRSKADDFVLNPKVPKLLDRNTKLQMGQEWELVQNQYSKNLQQIRKNKDIQEAKLNIAQLFVNEARITGEHPYYYPAALNLLDEILDTESTDHDLLFRTLSTKATVLLSLHQFKEALETGEKALTYNQHHAQIYGVLVDAHVELGQYEAAIQMADKMMLIRPDLRSYARVSYLREIHGDVKGAIEAMQMAIASAPVGYEESAWTRLTLGQLYQQYNQLEAAEQQYQVILKERKDYPFAIGALAEVEMEKGNFAKAEKYLKEALAIIPEVGFTINLAKVYQATNREEEAEALAATIPAMLAEDEAAGHNMNLEYAEVYADILGNIDKALAYTQKEFIKRPKNIDVNLKLAELYVQKNDLAKAQIHVEAAQITNSKHPKLLHLQASLN